MIKPYAIIVFAVSLMLLMLSQLVIAQDIKPVVFSDDIHLQDISKTASPAEYEVCFQSALHFGKTLSGAVKLFLWMPAQKTPKSVNMPFGAYLQAEHSSVSWQEDANAYLKANSYTLTSEQWERLRQMPTRVQMNAQPVSKRFPVIIFGNASNGTAYMYSTLCEALASAGYVVICVSSYRANENPCGFSASCVERQYAEIEAVLQYAKTLPNADSTTIGVASWSFGGMATALLASEDRSIKALVSMDAALGYDYSQKIMQGVNRSPESSLRLPTLHLIGLGKATRVSKNLSRFESMPDSLRCVLAYDALGHADFAPLFGEILPYAQDRSNQAVFKELQSVKSDILHFFDAFLKQRPQAQNHLRSRQKTMPSLAETALRVKFAEFQYAFALADTALLATALTDDYTHTNGASEPINASKWLQYVHSRREQIEKGLLVIDSAFTENLALTMRGSHAVISCKSVVVGKREQKPFRSEFRVLQVWVREENFWKRLAFHDTKIE